MIRNGRQINKLAQVCKSHNLAFEATIIGCGIEGIRTLYDAGFSVGDMIEAGFRYNRDSEQTILQQAEEFSTVQYEYEHDI